MAAALVASGRLFGRESKASLVASGWLFGRESTAALKWSALWKRGVSATWVRGVVDSFQKIGGSGYLETVKYVEFDL